MAIIRFFSSNLKSEISNYNYEGIETTDTSFSLLDETSGMVFGGIEGSGFTYYSWSNIPSAGTINNIYSLAPDLARRWEVTGLTLSSNMNDLIRALRMDDPFGNLKTMFSGNDQIFGSKENDWMAYQGGSDVIDGGAGIDRLYFDTSFYASVTINLATGKQIMNGFVSTVVNIEEVVTTSASDTIVGSILGNYINAGGGSDLVKAGDGDDVILGGGSDDTLYGEAGNDEFIQAESSYDDDKIDGGSGIDSVVYRTADYSVNVNLATSSAYKNKSTYYKDTLINIENAVGSRFNDELTGNDGNNVLDGGFGNDIINGGLGVDTVIYNNATHSVQINLNTGQAIGMGIDTISNVENANGSRFNDVFTGNSLANHFQGGLGVDIFNGGLGNDVLDGGAGSDWSYYNSVSGAIGVKVSLNVTGAQNTLAAGVDTLISIENLLGSKNADILIGNVSNNILSGGAGMDSLDGGAGNDRIIGGLDKDTLTGGAGADVFVIGNINDVLGQNFDTITDFLGGVDKIDLSGIDSNVYIAGDQSFSFIGSAQFSAAGQLRYANSMLYGDVTGDGVSDFSIALTGVTTLLSSHMIL